jgi:hypothetical protein
MHAGHGRLKGGEEMRIAGLNIAVGGREVNEILQRRAAKAPVLASSVKLGYLAVSRVLLLFLLIRIGSGLAGKNHPAG